MALFLGIDAGGTQTRYALADERRELARVAGRSIKRMRVDAETASDRLDAALRELVALAGVPLSDVTRTCVGTAGERVPLVADWLRSALRERVAGELILLGDVEIALDAAFGNGPGVLVLAGTGSNVVGRTRQGAIRSAGGWGPVLAEQGSGHRIGVEALRAIFAAKDAGTKTILLPAVLEHWSLSSEEALVELANGTPPPDFSRLTEVVVRCAALGDVVATNVLKRQGEELAEVVCTLMRRLRMASREPRWVPELAFAGSIMEKVVPVRTALIAAVGRQFPGVIARPGVVDPMDGAIGKARRGD